MGVYYVFTKLRIFNVWYLEKSSVVILMETKTFAIKFNLLTHFLNLF